MSEQGVPPPDQRSGVGGCFAVLGGFAVGFIGAGIVIGVFAGAGLSQLTNGSVAPGVAMLVISIAVIVLAVLQLRQNPVPFLQGVMIGAASMSVLTGLCGAILILAK